MRYKVLEPVLLLGKQRFANVDIRIRVKGGGHVSQIYAIRQAIAKALVAFYQKCEFGAEAGRLGDAGLGSGWVGCTESAVCRSCGGRGEA